MKQARCANQGSFANFPRASDPTSFRLVILESPYGGTPEEVERNVEYARACMRDCLKRGESPYASHLLYTQPGVLDDADARERALGIAAGFAWRTTAAATVVYLDLGVSTGMLAGMRHAIEINQPVGVRMLSNDDRRAFTDGEVLKSLST